MQDRNLIDETTELTEKKVNLAGWISNRRDHGKLIFLDLRDHTGTVQVVVNPQVSTEAHKIGNELRKEYVVKITGLVKARPEKLINPDLPTGTVEIEAENIEILNTAENPPFDLLTDGKEVDEAIRLQYRYLDLRRERLQKNLRQRHEINLFIRNFLTKENFVEIETPILSKSTPEGARDYVVPSRLHHGEFYALPQAPQQYKQLFMVGGLERYFQIARCFRDEDTRGDRQPEFTQMDLEMSYVDRENVMALNEKLLIELVKTVYPDKKIQQTPFPRLSLKEAMEKYGTDRPDLREDPNDPNLLAFAWIIDFPFFEKTDEGAWTFTHNPFSAPLTEHMDDLLAKQNIAEILTSQYDIVLNGLEIGGGSIRNHRPEALKSVLEIIGLDEEKINDNFGHMLEAFSFGVPPHGGIAWGLDRLITVLQNEPNIREVIAFPKTGDGRDLMMNAPAPVSEKQLKELALKIQENKSS